mgnify:CR=1 FL=1
MEISTSSQTDTQRFEYDFLKNFPKNSSTWFFSPIFISLVFFLVTFSVLWYDNNHQTNRNFKMIILLLKLENFHNNDDTMLWNINIIILISIFYNEFFVILFVYILQFSDFFFFFLFQKFFFFVFFFFQKQKKKKRKNKNKNKVKTEIALE